MAFYSPVQLSSCHSPSAAASSTRSRLEAIPEELDHLSYLNRLQVVPRVTSGNKDIMKKSNLKKNQLGGMKREVCSHHLLMVYVSWRG